MIGLKLIASIDTIPKGKKRKLNVAEQRQSSNIYYPVTQTRITRLSDLDSQLMMDTFIPNDKVEWSLTSNCKVGNKNGEKFRIRVLVRARVSDKKGKRKNSQWYNSIIDAENNAFNFRYSFESRSVKLKINDYKENL